MGGRACCFPSSHDRSTPAARPAAAPLLWSAPVPPFPAVAEVRPWEAQRVQDRRTPSPAGLSPLLFSPLLSRWGGRGMGDAQEESGHIPGPRACSLSRPLAWRQEEGQRRAGDTGGGQPQVVTGVNPTSDRSCWALGVLSGGLNPGLEATPEQTGTQRSTDAAKPRVAICHWAPQNWIRPQEVDWEALGATTPGMGGQE